MTLRRYNPVTPGQRLKSSLVIKLGKSKPQKGLIRILKGAVGRDHGQISVRHRVGGAKKFLRLVDFKRNKLNIPAKVAALEYDPSHGPLVALLNYKDGEKRYILAPQGLIVGDMVVSGDEEIDIKPGNCTKIKNIPIGTVVHNIEILPKRGGQLVRGAGCGALISSSSDKYVIVKMPSGEIRRILGDCYATIGALTNEDKKNVKIGKAGRKWYLGIRPTVRGVSMAWKHPHGGSYRSNGVGRDAPLSPWGWNTKGKKTRKRRNSDKFIIQRKRS